MFPIPAGIVTAVPNTGRDGVTTPIATAIAEGQGGIVSITVAAVIFTGSLIVAEFASLADAEAWAKADPYVAAGVYADVVIKPFKQVLP